MEDYLGEFEQVLLFTLLELGDESDGGAIRRHIEKRIGRVVSPGAVYTAMDRMGARGLVTSRVETTPAELGGRRRRYYRLRPAGTRALERSYRLLTQSSCRRGARRAWIRSSRCGANETTRNRTEARPHACVLHCPHVFMSASCDDAIA